MNAQTHPRTPIWFGISRDDMTPAQLRQFIEDQKAILARDRAEANSAHGNWQQRRRCEWHAQEIEAADYWLFILESGSFNSINEARADAPHI